MIKQPFLPTHMEEVIYLTQDMEPGEEFLASIPREEYDAWLEEPSRLRDDLDLTVLEARQHFVDIVISCPEYLRRCTMTTSVKQILEELKNQNIRIGKPLAYVITREEYKECENILLDAVPDECYIDVDLTRREIVTLQIFRYNIRLKITPKGMIIAWLTM